MDNIEQRPLDQRNRDWSKGNCYYIALEFLKAFPSLVESGLIESKSQPFLVHGKVGKDVTINHAWVEYGDMVMDHSNNQKIHCPTSEYYDANNAKPARKFSRDEADAILQSNEEADGSFGNMNWSEYTDEEVRKCLSKYNPANSPFANDTIFSDPNDTRNGDPLNNS